MSGKVLDQSVFEGAPSWAKWAFVTATGLVFLTEIEPFLNVEDGCFSCLRFIFPPRRKLVGDGYDATSWQASLIAKIEVAA